MTDPVIKLFVQGYEEEIARLREQLAVADLLVQERDLAIHRAEAAEAQLAEMREALERIEQHCNDATQVIASAGTHAPSLNKARVSRMFNVIYRESIKHHRAALASPVSREAKPPLTVEDE